MLLCRRLLDVAAEIGLADARIGAHLVRRTFHEKPSLLHYQGAIGNEQGAANVLLDEPSLGLSPRMQGDVFATVQRIAASGVTVLIVEQNVRGALLISDRALVMEQGRKFMEGPANEVRTDPRIRQAYLGGNIQQTAA